MAEKKLFLLDAYALIFRAYYAFIRNPRINSKGLNTSAMFGFTNTLLDVLDNQKPSHIAVVFDHKSKTFREQEHSFYKAHRDETPEDIRISEPYIREIIEAYKIPILESPGYEADDVIGTLAKKAEKEGFKVYMMTPDKDFAQLVSENIWMYKPGRNGNRAELMGVNEVCEKFQITDPIQVIDILGLMGDAVDNIPGIPGVGEKTAMKLVGQYHSVENLYEHTEELKGKLKERVEENKESAFISKKLATILLDAPVDFEPSKLIAEEPDTERLSKIFAELEFRGLGKRVLGKDFAVNQSVTEGQLGLFGGAPSDATIPQGKSAENIEHQYLCVDNVETRADLIKKLTSASHFAFDTETTGLDPISADIVGMSFSINPREAFYVPCSEDFDAAAALVKEFAPAFESKTIIKIGHNIKFDMKVLARYNQKVNEPIYDSMVSHYVSESQGRHKMDLLAEAYLGYSPISIETLIGKKGKNQKSMRSVPLDKITEYAAEDADITLQFYPIFQKLSEEKGATPVLEKIEFPLIPVLMEMELEGVNLDTQFLSEYSSQLNEELVSLQEVIFGMAGTSFNLDSPKQMGEILFNQMKIPYSGKKTKTGQYSTNEDTLSRLKDEHEIIAQILSYRENAKLRSTYVDALPQLVNPITGRVHTTFNQTIAATGRLSSLNPNLQNIPIRTERGRRIRKAFIPRDVNHILLSADYSQVELRIIAAISQDKGMIEAFEKGEDIHAATAAKVFGVPIDEVSREQRRKAKAVNFGIAYGQSAFGLSQTLRISRSEAGEIIENYFKQYPGIKDYMSKTVEFAKENGYVQTLMGRRRYLRDINSRNFTVRSQAERNAINSPIQGSAADLIKLAMINISKAIKKEGLQSKMTLQVHDELVFDARKDELTQLKKIVEKEMKNAIPKLKVPINVDIGEGSNWLEAH